MSDTPLPAYVDERKIFTQQGVVEGVVDLARLPVTRSAVRDCADGVQVKLRFGLDANGRQVIAGQVQAEVTMECQRCLEPMALLLEDEFQLAVVADEAAIAGLDRQYDPWLCHDHRIELGPLVDEQLALCMPIVALHADDACVQAALNDNGSAAGMLSPEGQGESGTSPFAILAQLTRK